jgi:hypothetical protein
MLVNFRCTQLSIWPGQMISSPSLSWHVGSPAVLLLSLLLTPFINTSQMLTRVMIRTGTGQHRELPRWLLLCCCCCCCCCCLGHPEYHNPRNPHPPACSALCPSLRPASLLHSPSCSLTLAHFLSASLTLSLHPLTHFLTFSRPHSLTLSLTHQAGLYTPGS